MLGDGDVAELLAAAPAEVDGRPGASGRHAAVGSRGRRSRSTRPTRENLLNGWDDIALTFNREDEIAAYEGTRERKGPDTLALGA